LDQEAIRNEDRPFTDVYETVSGRVLVTQLPLKHVAHPGNLGIVRAVRTYERPTTTSSQTVMSEALDGEHATRPWSNGSRPSPGGCPMDYGSTAGQIVSRTLGGHRVACRERAARRKPALSGWCVANTQHGPGFAQW
jgi:hypothetical protein